MSVADDPELRDLVSQILEKKGVLAKIRAELRASVFLALEEQFTELKQPFVNTTLREYLATSDSALSLCLVREFLEYLELDHTLSVFDRETSHGKDYEYKGRDVLIKDLHLERSNDGKGPLLTQVLQNVPDILRALTISNKGETGDFDANAIKSPKTGVPSNLSFAESSISSLDHSHTPFNQTFTTGALVTSFGSPDSSLDRGSPEGTHENFQIKNRGVNEKKSHFTLGGLDAVSDSKGIGEILEQKKQGETSDSAQQAKDRPVHTSSINSQTSLSNLPPLTDNRTSRNQVTDQKSLLSALAADLQDNYEEDFSSESSGGGDKEEKERSGRTSRKKETDLGQEYVSSKDSPVASVSEELEGETNSGTDDVLNSAASVDTADSSLSHAGSKKADYMEII